ncbi:hypothetical protein ACFYXY_30415, partial [Paenibacillus lactis]
VHLRVNGSNLKQFYNRYRIRGAVSTIRVFNRLYGSVAVQVKGTEVEIFSQTTRSFSLELGHYENFYSKSGTLLLVVEIIAADHSMRIFYKHLLPQELLYIINTCKQEGRKSKSVKLRPLDETTLDIVCFRFLQEQKYQPPILVEKNPLHEREFDETT